MNNPETAFGFSFESEDEIQSIARKITEQAQTHIAEISAVVNTKTAQVTNLRDELTMAQAKLKDINNLLTPFLENLAAEPEKVYIKWPDRAQKIMEFKNKLEDILRL